MADHPDITESHSLLAATLPTSSSPRHGAVRPFLQDDINCIERLSQRDQGHPHFRLALLWRIIYHRCGFHRGLSLEFWLKTIEGSDHDDVWLWQDGDEDWIAKNIRGVSGPAGRYPSELSRDIQSLSAEHWKRAGEALQRRQGRSNNFCPIDNNVQLRIFTMIWLLLFCDHAREADLQRGVVSRNLIDLVSEWLDLRLLFDPTSSNTSWIRTCSTSVSEDHICLAPELSVLRTNWIDVMLRMYSPSEIEGVCLSMTRCQDCATRYDYRIYDDSSIDVYVDS
jgi:hypothetical protein